MSESQEAEDRLVPYRPADHPSAGHAGGHDEAVLRHPLPATPQTLTPEKVLEGPKVHVPQSRGNQN